MRITRETVLSTIDQAMADRNEYSNTLDLAKAEFQSILEKGPIDGEWYITSHRPVIGKIIIIVKRFFRKMLHGYIPHLVEEENLRQEKQNRVLHYYLSLLERTASKFDELNNSIDLQQKRIELLEKQIIELNFKNKTSIRNLEEECILRIEDIKRKLENGTKRFEERTQLEDNRFGNASRKIEETLSELEALKITVSNYAKDNEERTRVEDNRFSSAARLIEETQSELEALKRTVINYAKEYEERTQLEDDRFSNAVRMIEETQSELEALKRTVINYSKEYEERTQLEDDRFSNAVRMIEGAQVELETLKRTLTDYEKESAEKAEKESEKINRDIREQKNDILDKIALMNRTLQESIDSEGENRRADLKRLDNFIENNSIRIDEKYSSMAHYSDFENIFRGDSGLIKEWQSVYADYFKGRKNVLDIGCGRGEFLTLLQEASIPCKGIDQSKEMVELCRSRGLDVEQADMFDYLEGVPDNTIDGVFCCQVVEHLTTNQMLRLISLLKIKVKENSPVVIETINPGNINSSANGFYMDLTHVRPVHSSTLSFLMDKNGFPVDKVLYIHPETERMLPHIETEGAESINRGIDNINRLLFDARDYAIIAHRG